MLAPPLQLQHQHQHQQHLLPLLPLPQLLGEEQLSPELTTALETLWQPLYEGQALGLHLGEVEEAEEEVAEEVEVEAEGNQLLSLHSNSSPSHWPQIYESWGCFPKSLKEKETRPTPS